jgi:hypothetical protein
MSHGQNHAVPSLAHVPVLALQNELGRVVRVGEMMQFDEVRAAGNGEAQTAGIGRARVIGETRRKC